MPERRKTELPAPYRCPHCGERWTDAESPEYPDEPPCAGALVVCWRCAGLFIFSADLRPRLLTEAELDLEPSERAQVESMQAQVRQFHALRRAQAN